MLEARLARSCHALQRLERICVTSHIKERQVELAVQDFNAVS